MSAALVRRFRPFHRNNSSPTGPIVNHISRLGRDEGGAVALLAGLTLMLICGMVGLAIDIGVWYRTARAMQNAADAAVIAAARDGGSSWNRTGQAVAARYGFVNSDGISVDIQNGKTCPNGGANCYEATIEEWAPQFFSQLFVEAPRLRVSAMAGFTGPSMREYCLVALAQGPNPVTPAIRTNGAPFAELTNCPVMSNTDMRCNGHGLNAPFADAHGTNHGCGIGENGVKRLEDPYEHLAANISPPSGAGARAARASAASATNPTEWGGTVDLSFAPAKTVSGNLRLTADLTVRTASSGTVLYIVDGTLNLQGHKLTATNLTIVFTGTNGNSTSSAPYPTGGGTLDIAAPTTGPWKGVAIYIDPRTVGPQTITYHGNSPNWRITGLVYMPHASLTISGAVGKATSGQSCFALVVDNLRVNGTARLLTETKDCDPVGLTLPRNTIPTGSPKLQL